MSVSSATYRRILAAGSNALSTASGSTSSSAWTQVIASTSTSILITGVAVGGGQSAVVDIGTGSAASEVVVASVYSNFVQSSQFTQVSALTVPVRVPAGTRVAVRNAATGAATVAIEYVSEGSVS